MTVAVHTHTCVIENITFIKLCWLKKTLVKKIHWLQKDFSYSFGFIF